MAILSASPPPSAGMPPSFLFSSPEAKGGSFPGASSPGIDGAIASDILFVVLQGWIRFGLSNDLLQRGSLQQLPRNCEEEMNENGWIVFVEA